VNAILRPLRPLYALGLRAVFGRRGLPWRVNGETFRIDPRVRHFVPHESEKALFSFLHDHIQPGDLVFDIGSFLGIYAMLAARAVGPAGRGLPSSRRWQLSRPLRAHAHELWRSCRARNVGIGAERQRRSLVTFNGEPYRNMIAARDHRQPDGPSVDVVSVDQYARHRPPAGLIRMIQGMEFEVLRGASRLLKESGGGCASWPRCT
jgi:FkbM family methyltransferase